MLPGSYPSSSRGSAASRAAVLVLTLSLNLALGCQGDIESRLAEIRSLQAAGQLEESIEPLRGLITTNSSHPEVNYRLGLALARTGRQSLAIWPLQKAVDSEEYAVEAGLLLMSTLLHTEDFDEAVRAADRVLAIEPENRLALYGRSRANISGSRPEAALADADYLLSLDAEDTHAMVMRLGALADLGRLEETEQAQIELERIANESGDAVQAARACAGRGKVFEMTERFDRAGEVYLDCFERYPDNDVLRTTATDFFVGQHKYAAAVAIWQRAVEDSPENPVFRIRLAQLLQDQGKTEEAEAVLQEMLELFDSASAWRAMANFHRKNGDNERAREAIEQAIERTPGSPSSLLFELADLLIDEGELERAREIAAQLEEPAYSELLRGSIALAEDDPESALEFFDAGLRRWPNHAGARYLAGVAAERTGDLPRAMAEYREATRNDDARTDAALRLAQLYFEQAEYAAAREFATRHIDKRPFSGPTAHILAARSAAAEGLHEEVDRVLHDLIQRDDQQVTALLEMSAAATRLEGPDKALEVLELVSAQVPDAADDPRVVRMIVGLMTEAGRSDDALKLAKSRVAASPDDAMANDLLGRVLALQRRDVEARAAFEAAIVLDPELAAPHEGLGRVALASGRFAEARGHFETASRLDPSSGEYFYATAQTYIAEGERERAITLLEQAIEVEAAHAGACNDLAWLLADSGGDLELALQLARRAVRAAPGPATRDTLGWVLLQRGDGALAQNTFEQLIESQGESPSLLYHLGLALVQQGKNAEAIDTLRKAVSTDPFPDAPAATAELARLEKL